MDIVVKSVSRSSPASKTIIRPGDILRKINGRKIGDVLDYMYLSYERQLMLELTSKNGKMKLVLLTKPEGADIGLEFDTFLMDTQRSCANKCIFCFIDQLPAGMRDTLYYKDDDVRLSFLQGNYVTLTNLTQKDIDRIIELKISPINVSVHSLDPSVRTFMLGTRKAAAGISALKALADARITLNCQIVCCPGVNDGAELSRTMEGLYKLGSGVSSVSIVPVGLTKYREGLAPLKPFDGALALKTVEQVEGFAEHCLQKRGSRVFFCADELYIKAGLRLPRHAFYEDYPQLENGVGMMRLFITEFMEELRKFGTRNSEMRIRNSEFSAVTGTAAGGFIENLLVTAAKNHVRIRGKIFIVRNMFFGEMVTVSGLITGGDIISQLRGRDIGSRLLIPRNMLRSGEEVFLDNVTVTELSEALGVPVRVVKQDGADLFRAFIGE